MKTTTKFSSVLKITGIIATLILTGCATDAENMKSDDIVTETAKTVNKDKSSKKTEKATDNSKKTTTSEKEKTSDSGKIKTAEKDTKSETASESEKKENKEVKSETKTEAKTSTSKNETTTVSKPATGTTSSQKQNTTVNKPTASTNKPAQSTGNTAKQNPAPASNTNNSSNTASASKPAECQHDWVAQTKTVHHDAVTHTEQQLVKEAYDEPVYEDKNVCNYCGAILPDDFQAFANHLSNCGELVDDPRHPGQKMMSGATYSSKPVLVNTIHHDAEYTTVTVVDKDAYDETIITSYVCSKCGATKK